MFPDYTDLTKVMILALPTHQIHSVHTVSPGVSPTCDSKTWYIDVLWT